jgi:hypothetical protein
VHDGKKRDGTPDGRRLDCVEPAAFGRVDDLPAAALELIPDGVGGFEIASCSQLGTPG